MGLTKALETDGLPLMFFQSGWFTIKEEVVGIIQNFFIFGSFKYGINDANLMLIQKRCARPQWTLDRLPFTM